MWSGVRIRQGKVHRRQCVQKRLADRISGWACGRSGVSLGKAVFCVSWVPTYKWVMNRLCALYTVIKRTVRDYGSARECPVPRRPAILWGRSRFEMRQAGETKLEHSDSRHRTVGLSAIDATSAVATYAAGADSAGRCGIYASAAQRRGVHSSDHSTRRRCGCRVSGGGIAGWGFRSSTARCCLTGGTHVSNGRFDG